MGAQGFDARRLTFANSSIPLEKRPRLGKNDSPRVAAAVGPRNGSCMLKSYFQRLFADPKGMAALVRRLLLAQAAGQWRRYALAFGLMGIAAASTALGAFLVGDVINQKNLPGIPEQGILSARQGIPSPRDARVRACRFSHSPLSSHLVASDLIWRRYPHFRDT
jgi:hypothetical protein